MTEMLIENVRMGSVQRGRYPQSEPQSFVPWWILEIAYADYASRYSNSQSLERLVERGGFGREELLGHLRAELNRRHERG